MNIEFNNIEPIYIQIINHYKRLIASGELKGSDKLPSVRELALELKVNPNTIQKAFSELEREDLVYTVRGTGKFVVDNMDIVKKLKVNMAKEVIENFISSMKSLGFEGKEIIEVLKTEVNKGFNNS